MAQTDEGHIRDALQHQQVALRIMVRRLQASDPNGAYERPQEDYRDIIKELKAAQGHIDSIRVRGDGKRRPAPAIARITTFERGADVVPE